MTDCTILNPAMESLRAEFSCSRSFDSTTLVVATGRYYSDGDPVEVYVRPQPDKDRLAVSDGGLTFSRRSLYAAEELSRTAKSLWDDIIQDFGVLEFSDRIYATGPVSAAADLIGRIADVCLALDSVRLLSDGSRRTFASTLSTWLKDEAGFNIKTESSVSDRFGNKQKFTAIVEAPDREILVQAAGGRGVQDLKRPAEHAYFAFTGLNAEQWPMDARLIVVEHLVPKTDNQRRAARGLIDRLSEVAHVASFEQQLSLSAFIRRGSDGQRDLVTNTYGQTSSWG
ncbi:DUF1828 domain-containing protein [Paenarthrobacter nitroguajacolicus]|uniref:DUF1828 domain-containing protein n=1 Tax=Paenarthrobacter nitroguajacolicus TaxID=211146 RepID=UPI00248B38E0|nr:DUF1828 domain-containing protein [Paenarthrobacter nitroguajacolicus]MDI2032964.1 hypothetical protein [Paenarthrobacter nitroguajacolicus]